MLLPTDRHLPILDPGDLLGRGVFSNREAERWRKGKGVRDTFLGAKHEISLSVDRLGLAPDNVMTRSADAIAARRGPGRAFYGWAVVTVRHASQAGRSVRASLMATNPCHADIDLNIRADLERRDAQKQHADDLAAGAEWKDRSAPE